MHFLLLVPSYAGLEFKTCQIGYLSKSSILTDQSHIFPDLIQLEGKVIQASTSEVMSSNYKVTAISSTTGTMAPFKIHHVVSSKQL